MKLKLSWQCCMTLLEGGGRPAKVPHMVSSGGRKAVPSGLGFRVQGLWFNVLLSGCEKGQSSRAENP